MGCFHTGLPVFVTVGTGPMVLTGILISLTAIITALVASITAGFMACVTLGSDAILSVLF